MPDPTFLSKVQDTVWNNPALKADTWPNGTPRTHCNQAALAVANGVGCHEFDPPHGGEPYTADQLWYFFQRKNGDGASNFLEKGIQDVHDLVQRGCLVYAVSPSWLLNESHGHIVSLTPGDAVKSESLNIWVPLCLNISTAALSSRAVGVNWAFPMKRTMPRFFVWKDSLSIV